MGYIKTLMIEMERLGVPLDIGAQHPCPKCDRKQSCIGVKEDQLLWVDLVCTDHKCERFMDPLCYTVPQEG